MALLALASGIGKKLIGSKAKGAAKKMLPGVKENQQKVKPSGALVKREPEGDASQKQKGGFKPTESLVPISSISKNLESIKEQESENNSLFKIKEKVISIEKLLGESFKFKSKQKETERKKTETTRRTKREEKLEKTNKKSKFSISIPGKGLFDNIMSRLFKFFFFIALGKIIPLIVDFLPKMEGIINLLGKVVDIAVKIFGGILDGFISFVDWGFKVYEQVKGIAKSIGGENLEKIFDGFTSNLEKFLNLALIIGMTQVGLGDKGSDVGKGGGGKNTRIRGGRNVPGRSRYGTSSNAARRYAQRFGRDAAVRRFGEKGVRSLGGKYARSGATNLARKGAASVLGKSGLKAASKIIKPVVGRIPIIGGLLEFAISWATGDPVGKAAFRGIGSILIGTIGTAIGGPVGAIVGGLVGGEGGGVLYDMFFENKKPQKSNDKVGGRAQGGQVTRGGRKVDVPIQRTIRRAPKVKTEPEKFNVRIEPGKDVGGEERIKEIYKGDPYKKPSGGWIFGGPVVDKDKYPAFYLLKDISKTLGNIPLLGSLMSSAINIALGQDVSDRVYSNFANNLGFFVESIVKNKVASSTSKIFDVISRMQEGGTIPSIKMIEDQIEGGNLASTLSILVKRDVDKALAKVKDSLNMFKDKDKEDDAPGGGPGGGPPGGAPGGGPGGGPPGGEYGGYAPTGRQKEIYDYLINVKKLSDAQALGLMANISRESSFRTDPGLGSAGEIGMFQWNPQVGRAQKMERAVPDWRTNWKGQIDYALTEYTGPQYVAKSFRNSQEAADWWMNEWEKPGDPVAGSKKHKEYLKTVPKAPDGTSKFREPKQMSPEISPGESRVSEDIKNFRKFRTQFGASENRNPTYDPNWYQIREMGTYGSGNYNISPLADDTNYEINVHKGAGHWENRAFDIPVPDSSAEGDKVADYWRSKGYTVIWKSEGHYNHVHVEVPKDKAQEWFKIVKKAKAKPQQTSREGVKTYKGQTYFKKDNKYYEEVNGRVVEIDKRIYDMVPTSSKPTQKLKSTPKGAAAPGYGKEGGGLISPINKTNIPNTFASYNRPGANTQVVFMPIPINSSSMSPSVSKSTGYLPPQAISSNSAGLRLKPIHDLSRE